MFEDLDNSYYSISCDLYYEKLNLIDPENWYDILDEKKTSYEKDGFFPHESIWKFIVQKFEEIKKSEMDELDKYKEVTDLVEFYLSIVEYVQDVEYWFELELFNNSRDFSKHFFNYLYDTSSEYNVINTLKGEIEFLINRINKFKFPYDDFDEGILNAWLNIYHRVYEPS